MHSITEDNVYCPWPDINPKDRVLHHYIRELKRNNPEKLSEIISVLDEKEARSMLFNHALWARDEQVVDFDDPHTITLLLAGRGFGKQARKDEDILTADGWKKLGEVEIGDQVYDETGRLCNVTNYQESEPEKVYEITFDTGEKIQVDQNHLWTTWTHRERKCFNRNQGGVYPEDWHGWSFQQKDRWGNCRGESIGPGTRTTEEIKETFRHGKRGDLNHSIPLTFPLQIAETEVPLPPYILGMWLGDGCKKTAQFTTIDYELIEYINNLGFETSSGENGKSHYIKGLISILRELGVLEEKCIPELYLNNCYDYRLQLLQGLMDTDGYINEVNGHCEFVQMRKHIAEDVKQLVASFGGKPVISEGRAMLNGVDHGTKYRVTWKVNNVNPFKLKRKSDIADKWLSKDSSQKLRTKQRMMVDIREVETPECGMRCLTVDSKSRLFLIGKSFIPTHNSYTLGLTAKRAVENYGVKAMTVLAVRNSDLRTTIAPAILSQYDPDDPNCPEYIAGKSEIRWPNGANAVLKSAESGPDATRGLNNELLLCDEIAFYGATNEEIITQSLLTLRLGMAKAYMFTTPKATPMMIDLVRQGKEPENDYVKLISGSTMDNRENLSKTFMQSTVNKYKGTRLERTEIHGELILDNEGAIFSREVIDNNMESINNIPEIVEVGIGVDLALTTKRTASKGRTPDKTGIVVSFLCDDDNIYVAHDFTGSYTSQQWGMKVYSLYQKYSSTYPTVITVESNTGGVDLLTRVFEDVERGFSSKISFTFSVSNKLQRAMPFSLLSEKGQIKFLETGSEETGLGPLIDELCSYDGTGRSPDRMDAFVFSCMGLSPNKKHYTSVSELLI